MTNFGNYYPQIFNKIAEHNLKINSVITSLIEKSPIITLIGIGTSYNAAQVGKQILQSKSKHIFTLEYANSFRFNHLVNKNILYLLISHSGRSQEIVEIAKKIKKHGAQTIGLTEDMQSPLAKVTDHVVPIHNFIEKAAFKSIGFTTTVITLLKLFNFDVKELKTLNQIINCQSITNQAQRLAKEVNSMDRFTILGSGPDYGIAKEGGLKLNELAWMAAYAYETEDFFHGKDGYVGSNDYYLLLKNNYTCNYQYVKEVLLSKGAKQVIIIDFPSKELFANLFSKIYLLNCLAWLLNRKFNRFSNQLRFNDLLKLTKII